MEAVGADLLPGALGWNQIGVRIGLPVQDLEAARDLLVMLRLGGQLDLAAAAEGAGDLLLPHDALHRIHGRIVGAVEGAGLVEAEPLQQGCRNRSRCRC